MKKKSKIILLTVTLIIACLAMQGCSKMLEPFNDAPVSGNNDDPAYTISFPDGFGNVARKCDGPNMVYSSFIGDGRSIAVVANDPRCVK